MYTTFVDNAEPSIWLGVEEEGAPDTVLPAAIPDPATDPFHFQKMTNLHCHLCGATLRRPEQFHELASTDRNDVIYLCRDETRCATRATFDPPTRHSADPHSTRPDRARPEKKAAEGA